jgi:hypothetical protein
LELNGIKLLHENRITNCCKLDAKWQENLDNIGFSLAFKVSYTPDRNFGFVGSEKILKKHCIEYQMLKKTDKASI